MSSANPHRAQLQMQLNIARRKKELNDAYIKKVEHVETTLYYQTEVSRPKHAAFLRNFTREFQRVGIELIRKEPDIIPGYRRLVQISQFAYALLGVVSSLGIAGATMAFPPAVFILTPISFVGIWGVQCATEMQMEGDALKAVDFAARQQFAHTLNPMVHWSRYGIEFAWALAKLCERQIDEIPSFTVLFPKDWIDQFRACLFEGVRNPTLSASRFLENLESKLSTNSAEDMVHKYFLKSGTCFLYQHHHYYYRVRKKNGKEIRVSKVEDCSYLSFQHVHRLAYHQFLVSNYYVEKYKNREHGWRQEANPPTRSNFSIFTLAEIEQLLPQP